LTDSQFVWGGAADIPVVGDWTGTGTTKIGVYGIATGTWYLDKNGNGQWDGSTTDGLIVWGGVSGDVPVVGQWTGGSTTKIGVFRNGTWYLDKNGNGAWDGPATDGFIIWGGVPGDVPLVGDWNASGTTKIGVYRNDGTWYLDTNGNGVWDTCRTDDCIPWGGVPGDVPAVGKW